MKPSFFALMIRLQWIDRAATSSFLVGITLQTFILALAVFETSGSAVHAVDLAVRGSVFSVVGILMFSSMSAITNDFDLGTAENALLGAMPFSRLVAYRAAATALISAPAIVAPFAAAALRWPELLGRPAFALRAIEVSALAVLLGYQLSWILNAFASPRHALQWARLAILIVGLNLLPLPGLREAALLFPTAWILRGDSLGFWATCAAWTALVQLFLVDRVVDAFELRLLDPRRG